MSDDATPAKVRLTDGLGPDGKLHADGYFTWHRRDGYVLDAKLPAEFVLADKLRAALDQKNAEYEDLKQTMHNMTRNHALQLDAARMAGVHSVQEQTAVIVRAALELLDAAGDTFPPERLAAFQRVFGGAAPAAPAGWQPPPEWVNAVMEQAQVFASAWSLVGGRFDNGNGLADAEQAKAELRAMLAAAPGAQGDAS